MASKASMSGRPALSFCFTWMGYQCSFRPSSPSCCLRGAGGDGEDAAIHAHVAHLHLVRNAAKGDDGPVLKFKRRDDAQLLHRPRQFADDEAASGLSGRFAFRQMQMSRRRLAMT